MQVLPVTLDLPKRLYHEIGRVITTHAYLEYALNRTIYALIDVDPKIGRIAIREPRTTERLEMIVDIAQIRGLQIEKSFLDDLRCAIQKVATARDEIANGIWLNHPGTQDPLLRITRAQWQPDKTKRGKVKRSIKPEGREFGVAECRDLAQLIRVAAKAVDDLYDSLLAQLPPLPPTPNVPRTP